MESDYLEDNIVEGPDFEVDNLMKKVKDMGDLYFVAQLILSKLEPSDKNRMIAELSYLLDAQSFINLLWYFEGQTIRIPTREELKEVLQLMSIYYQYNILEKPWKDAVSAVGIPYDAGLYNRIWTKYKRFMKSIENIQMPKKLRRPSEDDKLKEGDLNA